MPEWLWGLLELWSVCRPPNPAGMGPPLRLLPCAGGAGDQPAGLVDAFTMIDAMLQDRTPGHDG